MKTINQIAFQGDICIQRVDALPDGVEEVPAENGLNIVAHSETGHHHVMERSKATMYRLPESIYECFLVVDEPTTLDHKRDFDTHEPITFEPGVYRIKRQREYTPEGYRRVED